MVKDLIRKTFLIRLIENMQNAGSWTGETHIQKTVYFLQNLLNIPIEYEYVFYKHGPFSFELRDELGELRADNFLRMESKEPYGVSYSPGTYVKTLEEKFGSEIEKYNKQIKFITKKISNKNVVNLERLSTALYVQEKEGITDKPEIIERIIELKPHISQEDAEKAVKELDEYRKTAEDDNLICN